MKYQIRYQTLKMADLVHPPYNPRVQIERDTPEYDALKRSLEQHELVEPLVVNLSNMHCVGGNQRLTVMRDMGVEEETCVVIEQPDELKEKELCLALNKIKGRWDTEKTGELLRDDAVLDFETGFDLDEVKSYRAIEEATATDGDDLDELEDDTEEPDTLDELEEAAEDELEDDTEEPEAYGTSAKIGQIKIKLTADEYDELLNGIRDDGIFAEKDISAEMKRRILKND
jgi:ParB-like chromosome segregation protein Spo0J